VNGEKKKEKENKKEKKKKEEEIITLTHSGDEDITSEPFKLWR